MAIPLTASPIFAAVSMSIDTGEKPRLHEDYGNTEAKAIPIHQEEKSVAAGLGECVLGTETGLGWNDVST